MPRPCTACTHPDAAAVDEVLVAGASYRAVALAFGLNLSALGTELYRRIDAAANRYGCAAGMVARYAIEHGMRGALQRLQRELPPGQRPSAVAEATEAAERG